MHLHWQFEAWDGEPASPVINVTVIAASEVEANDEARRTVTRQHFLLKNVWECDEGEAEIPSKRFWRKRG